MMPYQKDGMLACKKYRYECEQYSHITKNMNVHWDPRLNILGTMEFAQVVSPRRFLFCFGPSPISMAGLNIDSLRKLHTKRVGADPKN